jgi:molybdenum cofactor cytidylyltransferase
MAEIPVLLLAAGSSSRMGRPKQLLPWGNQLLIEHQIQTLLYTGNPILVVLGANADLIVPVVEKFRVNIVMNKQWNNGIGSSISAGLNNLSCKAPVPRGVLIALLDQPFVTTVHFKKMLRTFQNGHRQIIVSGSASGWQGVPALFDAYYFKELSGLNGKVGAKNIIQQYRKYVTKIECNEILDDMDTQESYQRMLNRFLSGN